MFLAGSSRPPCLVSSVSPSAPQPWQKVRSLPECSKPLAGAETRLATANHDALSRPMMQSKESKPELLMGLRAPSAAAWGLWLVDEARGWAIQRQETYL